MNTLPFLHQVARYYASNEKMRESLADMAFVLPNRRSAQQLERYMKKELNANMLMPRLMSMNDLVDHIMRETNPIIASSIETLFLAYEAYRQSMGEKAGPFDSFAHWGQLIVNDFNDVDMNLVDARDLYTNLNDLKEISTNYIEDNELKESIRTIFGISVPGRNEVNEKMWNHTDDNGVKAKYVTLWNRLADIYERYGALLEEKGLTTQGKLYRSTVAALKEMGAEDLGFSRIVMVGHDLLSVSELAIFRDLQKKQVADYWWDNASPTLKNDNNPAKAIIDELSLKFRSPEQITPIATTSLDENGNKVETACYPSITVNYVPSVVGMAKCAFEGIKEVSADTAIILPDEVLLEPLLNSMPDKLINDYMASHKDDKKIKPSNAVNITMGYSLRRSNIATLIHLVTIAHKHASYNNTLKEWFFYREDVRNILSHPIIKMAYTDTVLGLNNAIEEQREFNIAASAFTGTPLAPLFTTLNTRKMETTDEVKKFISNLETFCLDLDKRIGGTKTETTSDDNKGEQTMTLQRAFIQLYVASLNQLRIAIDSVGLPVKDDTIFHLIDRATATSLVPFGGKSGEGLQVMGMLETRCIDFNDLRILSANEGTLPPKASVQSLIPDRFRAAFNMPTIALNDAAQVYRFYRLISRASSVTMYCNSSSNNEPSRFIEQMHKIFGIDVKRVKRTATITTAKELAITIDNAALREAIKAKYTSGDVNDEKKPAPCLSASSIKEFLKCPLKFYFHHLQGLSDDNAVSDFMDASQFGTIVHDTLQEFYDPSCNGGKQKFYKDDIDDFKKNRLEERLKYNINKTFNNKPEERRGDDLAGQALILKETLETYILRALEQDKAEIKDGYLEVVECEETHNVVLKLTPEVSVNFTFKADRIDRVGGKLRIIDYKTGSDDTSFKAVPDFFDHEKKKHPEAIMQLLIYCMAYVQLYGDRLKAQGISTIEPIIYKLSDIKASGAFMGSGKSKSQITIPLDKFYGDDLIGKFSEELAKEISRLWSEPIKQAPVEMDRCKYCNFTAFCRR